MIFQDTQTGSSAAVSHTASTTIEVNIQDIDNRPPWFQPCTEIEFVSSKACMSSGYEGTVNLNEQEVGIGEFLKANSNCPNKHQNFTHWKLYTKKSIFIGALWFSLKYWTVLELQHQMSISCFCTPQTGPLSLKPGPVMAIDGDKGRNEAISYTFLESEFKVLMSWNKEFMSLREQSTGFN